MNKINVVLNGQNVSGIKGETILQLCRRHGIDIPTLCHDDRLEPFSSCYVCVVEIKGMKNLQPSCSTRITEGMDIDTDSVKIYKSRKAALELLLSNHYADCAAPCKQKCPAGVDVQGYISLIEKGLYSEAIGLIKEVNPLPAICGRVCVRPCEAACRRNLLDEGTGVGIDYMKRFAADADLASDNHFIPVMAPSTGKKIAIIGAGPGGLSAAYFLQQKGHQCDIFEANAHPGGWLRYGIPEYRLPNDLLDKEVSTITELGVNIFYNKKLGENLSYKELKKEYDAVILTIGSQRGTLIGCEGEDAEGIYSGIDFLRNMEMTGQRYNFKGKRIAVIGGGNTAMDCCRTSIRCGSTDVTVLYRRTEAEMPANPIEIHESKLEGVKYHFLTAPVRVNQDGNGKLKSISFIQMELGEPDASGRRRPVPKEGSDFDMEFDFVLAAIGQKTDINFLKDVNENLDDNTTELKANRWGDIDCNKETLQTGVPSIFAAGDGVSGPATIIEAIAQAKITAHSCNQFLNGEVCVPAPFEFLSKKDNFKKQILEDYAGKYARQIREEMPVLPASDRLNFLEVELGYASEKVAKNESHRCLECGCTEYFTCDLKKYSTNYNVSQNKFEGEFKEFNIDFVHPYIEIDNNKCILCARCVRICKEVVGANALGLVNRGFDTYIAPAMGNRLQDTTCESCGLCISTCPTGAITENVNFKPGPVKLDIVDTICNYCSLGCEISLHHKNACVMKVTGKPSLINPNGNLCRYPKFGYSYFNNKERITKPLIKKDDKFVEISYEEAFRIIHDKILNEKPEANAFYGGARLTNEELYLVQKLARAAAKTGNINSFHFLHGDDGYIMNSLANAPFEELRQTSKIYVVGAELNVDNAVAGFMVNHARVMRNVPVELISEHADSTMDHKVDRIHYVKSYYHFIKAANHYLLSNGLENMLFINDNCDSFEDYKTKLLAENYDELLKKSGICCKEHLETFAEEYNREMNAIIIYSEKETGPNTSYELFNLAMITGKLNKTANGLIALKEKNNTHGVLDMGVCSSLGVGSIPISDADLIHKMKEVWQVNEVPEMPPLRHLEQLQNNQIKNFFIFGEDPKGCAFDKEMVDKWFENANFILVMDYFMSDTAKAANLILPASFPIESGGTFTNTQRVIQEFQPVFNPKVDMLTYQQLIAMLKTFGINGLNSLEDVAVEAFSLLPAPDNIERYCFTYTDHESKLNRFFDHGADMIVKIFDDEFKSAFSE